MVPQCRGLDGSNVRDASDRDERRTRARQKFLLKTRVVGSPIEFTASGIECVGCTIENKEVTGKSAKIAFGKGSIRYTGLSVMAPAECSVPTAITTKPLVFHAFSCWAKERSTESSPEAKATSTFELITLRRLRSRRQLQRKRVLVR